MSHASLIGKNAIITGSTSGIGLGIAQQLAKSGANIVINSFTDSADDHALADQLSKEHNIKALYISADMSDAKACASLVEEASKQLGVISILVNNAGIQFVAPVDEFPEEKWDAIMAINLSSVFHTTKAAVPGMKQNGWGRIVNISSAHGLTASPYKSAYVAAKHGVVGFTKAVALELAEQNITCNAVCPAYVLTPLVESQIPEQMKVHNMDRETVIREVMLSRQPTKEFSTVEQIGDIVTFLCSDSAAQITGTPISVDGGWTAL